METKQKNKIAMVVMINLLIIITRVCLAYQCHHFTEEEPVPK